MSVTKPRMFSRRNFLKTSVLGALGISLSTIGRAAARQDSRPNILFLFVDDLRPQLGCYGHEKIHTPNIDALAASGTVFKRAYCQVPVCGASRASVMTGVRPAWPKRFKSAGSRADKDAPEAVTLGEHLKEQGYYTLSNGKVFHAMHDSEDGWSEPPWRSTGIYHTGGWAKYNKNQLWQNPESAEKINPFTGRGPFCEAADVPDSAYQDGQLADKTIADLKRMKDKQQPFFLACGFWRPHLPFNAPKKYWDLYKREEISLADNRFLPEDLPAQCSGSGEIDSYYGTGKNKKKDAFHREARHAYFACVSYIDAQVGRVLQALKDEGLADDTIVVLCGDHGWHLGEHTFWGKHNTLHNALHTPLILRVPGVGQGVQTDALVEFVDIMPTLCDLVQAPIPETVQGDSVAPLMKKPDRPWKQAVFSEWGNGKAVKTDRYLYTQWRQRDKIVGQMLYDHERDPAENNNVAEDAAYRDALNEMQAMLSKGWEAFRPGIFLR